MTIRMILGEDNALLREGMRGMLRAVDDLDLVATCADLPTCCEPTDELTPTSSSPTSGCRREDRRGRAGGRHCRRPPSRDGRGTAQPVRRPGLRPVAPGQRGGRSRLPAEGAGGRPGRAGGRRCGPSPPADRSSTRRWSRHWSSRPRAAATRTSTGSAPASRRCWPRWLAGTTTPRIAATLFITQRAVEKHINSIFAKLGVEPDDEGHPRVRAVLLYLSGSIS